jgi:hypothetical protein
MTKIKTRNVNLWTKSTLTLAAMLSIASCDSPLKSAKEAAENSKEAAKTGKAIKEYNEKTMESMKMGSGLQAREDAFKRAKEEKNFTAKTTQTAIYFQAMGFQLLGIMNEHSIDLAFNRDRQKADSVRDFVKKMESLGLHEGMDVDSALDKDNDMQTLYAFAAAMHEINLSQYNNLQNKKEKDLQIESFFDVVANSLLKKAQDSEGLIAEDELSLVDKEVLQTTRKLISVLKLRYQILHVVALGRMANIPKKKFAKLITKIQMRYFTWEPISNMGTEEMNYINRVFARAEKTKSLLNAIGETVEVDSDVKEIFDNLDWGPETINTSNDNKENHRDTAFGKLKANVEKI